MPIKNLQNQPHQYPTAKTMGTKSIIDMYTNMDAIKDDIQDNITNLKDQGLLDYELQVLLNWKYMYYTKWVHWSIVLMVEDLRDESLKVKQQSGPINMIKFSKEIQNSIKEQIETIENKFPNSTRDKIKQLWHDYLTSIPTKTLMRWSQGQFDWLMNMQSRYYQNETNYFYRVKDLQSEMQDVITTWYLEKVTDNNPRVKELQRYNYVQYYNRITK